MRGYPSVPSKRQSLDGGLGSLVKERIQLSQARADRVGIRARRQSKRIGLRDWFQYLKARIDPELDGLYRSQNTRWQLASRLNGSVV